MSHFVKFIICMVVGLSSVSAAAAFPCPEYHHLGVTRVNCVIEKYVKIVEWHKGCDHPCIKFFDIRADSKCNLNASIQEFLIEKKIIDLTESIKLELYGMSSGRSIHDKWRTVTEVDINEFWEHITGLSADLKASRDLDRVHIGALNFARYIFKVSFVSPK
jgi:hypothetical protein